MNHSHFLFEPFLEAKIVTALTADGVLDVFSASGTVGRINEDFTVVSVSVDSATDDGWIATSTGPEYAVYEGTATIVHVVERTVDHDDLYERIARTRYTFALQRKAANFPEVAGDLCVLIRYALPGSCVISPPAQGEVKDRAIQTFGFKFSVRPEAIA